MLRKYGRCKRSVADVDVRCLTCVPALPVGMVATAVWKYLDMVVNLGLCRSADYGTAHRCLQLCCDLCNGYMWTPVVLDRVP
jgi:hypothetical protein